MILSLDESLLVLLDFYRVILVDLKDITNLILFSIYDITVDNIIPPLRRSILSIDSKVLFLGTETDSLISLNISSLNDPKFLS